MNPFNLYEAYTAVYDEDLRDELEVIDEDLSFIDDLSDNELTQIMEEILRDGEVGLNECYYAFDEEVLTEARVTTGRGGEAGSSSRVTYSKGDVERRERVGRKHAAKRLQVATGRAAERIRSGAESAKTKAGGAISALAGGAAEAGRKGKAAAQRVGGKLAAAKERISGFVKRVGKAAGAGYRAAKAEFSGQAARSTVGGSSDGGQKETEQSGRKVKATATKLGLEKLQKKPGSQGKLTFSRHMRKRVVPIGSGGKELEGAAYSQSVRSARKDKSVKESYETLTLSILEDLIYEGYARDYNEALYVLESMSDYEVGELAESYLVEEDFEAWVDGLWEEGYDLSDYTWEGLYEAYFEEAADNVIMSVKSPSGKSRSVSRLRANSERPSDIASRRFSQMLSDRGKNRESDVQSQRFAYLTKRGIERATNRSERDENDFSDVRLNAPKPKPARELRGAERQRAFRDIRQKKVDQKFKDQRNVEKFRRRHGLPESYDAYDEVLNYLLDEGYAETVEDATTIMANMSEEWRDEILEVTGGGKVDFMRPDPSRGMKRSPFEKAAIKQTSIEGKSNRIANSIYKKHKTTPPEDYYDDSERPSLTTTQRRARASREIATNPSIQKLDKRYSNIGNAIDNAIINRSKK